MRTLWLGGALAVVVMSLAACGGTSSSSATEEDAQRKADLYEIGEVQKTFHEALSTKDIELMLSIWAPNATITVGPGQTLSGTEEIRDHWLKTRPFEPTSRLIADSPTYKTKATANGDKGTLIFECHLIDTKTEKTIAISGADAQVARIEGQWRITNFVAAAGTLRP